MFGRRQLLTHVVVPIRYNHLLYDVPSCTKEVSWGARNLGPHSHKSVSPSASAEAQPCQTYFSYLTHEPIIAGYYPPARRQCVRNIEI